MEEKINGIAEVTVEPGGLTPTARHQYHLKIVLPEEQGRAVRVTLNVGEMIGGAAKGARERIEELGRY